MLHWKSKLCSQWLSTTLLKSVVLVKTCFIVWDKIIWYRGEAQGLEKGCSRNYWKLRQVGAIFWEHFDWLIFLCSHRAENEATCIQRCSVDFSKIADKL